MGERFYRDQYNLTMNNQSVPQSRRRPKNYVPTYYELLNKKKVKQEKSK